MLWAQLKGRKNVRAVCPRTCRAKVETVAKPRYFSPIRLDAKSDWGHARDFVEAAFARVQREIVWKGIGVEEKGVDAETGQILVEVDPRYFRPTEVDLLIGDPSKARSKLGWTPKKTFDELVTDMVESDLELFKQEPGRVNRRD